MPEFKTNYVQDPFDYVKAGREMGAEISQTLFSLAALKRQEIQRLEQEQKEIDQLYKFDEAGATVMPGGIIPRYKDEVQASLDGFQQAAKQAKITKSPEDIAAYNQAKQTFLDRTQTAVALSEQSRNLLLSYRNGSYKNSSIPLPQAEQEMREWMNSPVAGAQFMNVDDLYLPPTTGATSEYMPTQFGQQQWQIQFQNETKYNNVHEGTGFQDGTINDAELFPDMVTKFENSMLENPGEIGLAMAQFTYRALDKPNQPHLTDEQLNVKAPTIYNPANSVDAEGNSLTGHKIVKNENGLLSIEFEVSDENLTREQKNWRTAYKTYAEQYYNTEYDLFSPTDQTAQYEKYLASLASGSPDAINIGEIYATSIMTDPNSEASSDFIAGIATINGTQAIVNRGGARMVLSDLLYAAGEDGKPVLAGIRLQKPDTGIEIDNMTSDELTRELLDPQKFEEVYVDATNEDFAEILAEWRSLKKNKVTGRQAEEAMYSAIEELFDSRAAAAEEEAAQAEEEAPAASDPASPQPEPAAADSTEQQPPAPAPAPQPEPESEEAPAPDNSGVLEIANFVRDIADNTEEEATELSLYLMGQSPEDAAATMAELRQKVDAVRARSSRFTPYIGFRNGVPVVLVRN